MENFSDIMNNSDSDLESNSDNEVDNVAYTHIFIIIFIIISILVLYMLEKFWFYLGGIIFLIIYCLSLMGNTFMDKLTE